VSILDDPVDQQLPETKAPKEDTTRHKIWKLYRAGVHVKAIAAEVGKSLGYVHTEIRQMKLSGQLDPSTLRPRGFTESVSGSVVRLETIRVVACPRCRHRFEVMDSDSGGARSR
jgi:hypothetical protein